MSPPPEESVAAPRAAHDSDAAARRRSPRRWLRSALLVLAAFAGGAAVSEVAHATTGNGSLYAPFEQMGRVLALVDAQYVDPADRSKLVEGALRGMVEGLDPHSAYMPEREYRVFQGDTEGKFGGIGVEVDYRDDYVTVIAPIEGSPAERAGVRSGDQIVAVDGKSTRGERVDQLVGMMRGALGSHVRVTLRRKGADALIELDLVREEIRVPSVVAKRLVGDVAYVRIKQFQVGTYEEFLRGVGAVRNASSAPIRGVLLDLRSNPGGLVDEAEAIADELLESGLIYTTRHRGKVLDRVSASSGGVLAAPPVVVLVNEYSASSSELVAGALQDSRGALVVGQRTFGKGSVQTIFDLPSGAGLRLTTMRYYTPSGRSIQAQGIDPDILVRSATSAPDGIVREGDLEGHLEAEAPPARTRPQRIVVAEPPPSAAAPEGRTNDVPEDPSKGDDFVLKTAYEALRAAPRP